MSFQFTSLLFILIYSFSFTANATTQATLLFESNKKQVFQVRVIDAASGKRYSYGSGFLVNNNGKLATNYHVVSSFVNKPNKYYLDVVNASGQSIPAQLLNFDVVHDLALLKISTTNKAFFALNNKPLSKGDRLYAMGIPHDLGMTIIEGTYNGVVELSRFRKILFSGSLNSGMSGGPAFNTNGEIIGINVQKSGGQLSFLVPVSHLQTLMSDNDYFSTVDANIYKEKITSSLLTDQDQYFDGLFNKQLLKEPFGHWLMPKKLSPSLKCWGHTENEKDAKFVQVHQHCESTDKIFLNDENYTGGFDYHYYWIKSKHLNAFQFYQVLEDEFTHKTLEKNDDENVTKYKCFSQFINIDERDWKASQCTRAYKKHRNLYDVNLLLMQVDEYDSAMKVRIRATGISQEKSNLLFSTMMENIKWKN